jgi:hypothetical protein
VAEYNRRTFVGGSVAGLTVLAMPAAVQAAEQCVTGSLPGFQPSWLSVDCASKRNFQLFRKASDYVGLAGAVSMSFVRGSQGSYAAGNLFLCPWVKPKGQGKNLSASMPLNATQYVSATPIPDASLPLDEYFLRFVLKAPWTSFIGFQVDNLYSASDAKQAWCTNVEKLADGQGVGVDWTSHNLNGAWFGGSRAIPGTDACGGKAWRNLVVAGLAQASSSAC